MVHRDRICDLNRKNYNVHGEYIGCWIQSSPRIKYNYLLEYCKTLSEQYRKPIFVFVVLNLDYPDAKRRSFEFFLEGIRDFSDSLKKIGGELTVFLGNPSSIISSIGESAYAMVTDKGYLKFNRELNEDLASTLQCKFLEVEGNLIVPVEQASDHEEYGAYTIRKKITERAPKYLMDPVDNFILMSENLFFSKKSFNNKYRKNNIFKYLDVEKKIEIDNFLNTIVDDNYFKSNLAGGEKEAEKLLHEFIDKKLNFYESEGNNPGVNVHSSLSPYLHYGQVAPAYIYSLVLESGKDSESIKGFLEELLVRRELAFNFCYYNREYMNFLSILPKWAYDTMKEHRDDKREYIYTLEELENFRTHDNYWNSAQKELVENGTMHSYMRMYWAKKILEWSEDYEEAFKKTIYLNNRYFLDGRDPNSFTGVAWCYGKHDRPWKEREIFGKIRYMNENGLKRKIKKSPLILNNER